MKRGMKARVCQSGTSKPKGEFVTSGLGPQTFVQWLTEDRRRKGFEVFPKQYKLKQQIMMSVNLYRFVTR